MLDQMCEMEAPEAPAAAPGATGQPGSSPDAAGSALPGPVSVECRRKVRAWDVRVLHQLYLFSGVGLLGKNLRQHLKFPSAA